MKSSIICERSAKGLRAALYASVAVSSVVLSSGALAQDADEDDTSDDNVIIVQGIRSSLESALDERRDAEVILDGITADDVGSTPDLNLGEALQRIPGVQIDRSAERRDATISVRGLPGSYSKTTLMGMGVAAPTLGNNTNAFGIYDASIFSGANVVKSFTADTASGGIAANIDKKLQGALDRPKSQFVVRAEGSYEETSNRILPSVVARASKRITDTFAIYGAAAYSVQNFRRDRIGINTYGSYNLDAAENGYKDWLNANPGIATPVPANATSADTIILYPGDVRQEVRTSKGWRLSASAGVEFELSDEIDFRVDGIYSRRELASSTNDNLYYGVSDTNAQIIPTQAPIFIDRYSRGALDADGNAPPVRDVYLAPAVRYTDVAVNTGIRDQGADTSAWAVFPQLNYRSDDWKIDLIAGYSKAQYLSLETQNEIRARTVTSGGRITPDNQLENILEVYTGLDRLEDFRMNLITDERIFDFTGYTWQPTTNDAGANLQRPTAPRTVVIDGETVAVPQLSFLVLGANRGVTRDMLSFNTQIERFVEFGPFTSFEIGGQYDKENAASFREINAAAGLNFNALTTDIYGLNVAAQEGNFFGGLAPGAEEDNFRSFDLDKITAALGLPSPDGQFPNAASFEDYVRSEYSNRLIQRSSSARDSGDQLNTFHTSRENFEAYAMARFDLEQIDHLPIRGNFGVRYVRSKLNGLLDQDIGDEDKRARASFEAWLPSANMLVNLTDKLNFRAAYYRTYDQFDLGEFSPAPTRLVPDQLEDTDGNGEGDTITSYRVTVSNLDLAPRRGEAFDFGLSWYNRPGSVIGFNFFHKAFDDIARQTICPVGQSPYGVPAPLYFDEFLVCRSAVGFDTPTGEINPRVTITRNINLPEILFINGIEFQVQQNLDFLPGFWKGFGGFFNITRTWSQSDDPTRQLFNAADMTMNLVGYYENKWLSTRLAYNRQSAYDLQGTGSSTGGDRRVRPRGQLDWTIGVKPVKNLEVRFEAFNITNSIRQEYEQNILLPRRYDWDGRTLSLSVQYVM